MVYEGVPSTYFHAQANTNQLHGPFGQCEMLGFVGLGVSGLLGFVGLVVLRLLGFVGFVGLGGLGFLGFVGLGGLGVLGSLGFVGLGVLGECETCDFDAGKQPQSSYGQWLGTSIRAIV